MEENFNSNGNANPMGQMNAPEKKGISNTLLVVILLALVVILVLVVMTQKQSRTLDAEIMQKQVEINRNDEVIREIETQNSSDELDAITQDLMNTNVDVLEIE